jgi:hypothetical protein
MSTTDVSRRSRSVETFVVRLWTPGTRADWADPEIRGVVRHVATGTERRFASPAELLEILTATDPNDGNPEP